jgi:hypothetical protein
MFMALAYLADDDQSGMYGNADGEVSAVILIQANIKHSQNPNDFQAGMYCARRIVLMRLRVAEIRQ